MGKHYGSEMFESGGVAPSAYVVNDSDFEVSDVEGDMTEEERETKRKEKIKKKMNERVEKKALALFNERMKLENEKKNQQEFHTLCHTYETSNFQSANLYFSLSPDQPRLSSIQCFISLHPRA